MAQDDKSSSGLISTFMNSTAGQRLSEQARDFAQAQARKATEKVSSGLSSATEKAGNVAESGKLPAVGEGVKRLASGDSPAKAAVGTAVHGVGEKVKGGLAKLTGKKKGGGKSKSMNIVESIDVGVPVSTAYDQWTQFQDFARFMKGVESVEQTSETEQNWRAKVFKSKRTWKATVQEQIPDERIVWTSEGAKGSTKGVVTFHELDDNLTRVLLDIEYFPAGLFEKTGNIWRAAGRRARLDLKNYRRFIMMEGEATGSWRGEIRDSEVVKSPEDAEQEGDDQQAEDQQGDDQAEDQADDQAEDSDDQAEDSDDQAEDSDDQAEDSDDEAEDSDDEDSDDQAEDEQPEDEQAEDSDDQPAARSDRRTRPSSGRSGGPARSRSTGGSDGSSSQRQSGSGSRGSGQGRSSRRQPARAASS